ncbi:MAG TPA: hypothetical protein VE971_05225, partial [Candidatus Eisenbacteria bacterium]|nr:hypothetical protein [Candidatus Eisenbacteria bacterium]
HLDWRTTAPILITLVGLILRRCIKHSYCTIDTSAPGDGSSQKFIVGGGYASGDDGSGVIVKFLIMLPFDAVIVIQAILEMQKRVAILEIHNMRIAILEMQHRRRKQEEVANESGSLCTKD